MSVNFNWFKTYSIREYNSYGGWTPGFDIFSIEYDKDSDATSVAYSTRTKIQNTIERITGKMIPIIDESREFDTPEDIHSILIKPEELSIMMGQVLASEEMIEDKDDIKDRIELFKKLADDGFYITFDTN
jgi:methionine synthase II (cobalamin-independent)